MLRSDGVPPGDNNPWPRGSAKANGQTWGLLIAVDKYLELEKLHYSCSDAKALHDRLVATGIPADHVVLMVDEAGEQFLPF
jgi:hypothetical protein